MTLLRALALILVGTSLFAAPAHAATVNYTGSNYDAGTLSAGQSGDISTNPINLGGSKTQFDLLSGYLAPDTEIIITYAPTNKSLLSSGTELVGYGSYDYVGPHGHSKTASSRSIADGNHSTTTNTGAGGLPLVIADAYITGKHDGTVTITNNSLGDAYFLSFLESTKNFKNLIATYDVISLGGGIGPSEVPLPGSVGLFALALMAMGGLAYQNKLRSRQN